jgi:hypothetical protein
MIIFIELKYVRLLSENRNEKRAPELDCEFEKCFASLCPGRPGHCRKLESNYFPTMATTGPNPDWMSNLIFMHLYFQGIKDMFIQR